MKNETDTCSCLLTVRHLSTSSLILSQVQNCDKFYQTEELEGRDGAFIFTAPVPLVFSPLSGIQVTLNKCLKKERREEERVDDVAQTNCGKSPGIKRINDKVSKKKSTHSPFFFFYDKLFNVP